MAEKHSSTLTYWIVGAILVAVAFSLALPYLPGAKETWGDALVGEEGIVTLGGEVFLNILFALVVPLVVASVMAGILSLGDVRKLGKPGFYAVGYYFATTVLAVTLGIVLANLISPGEGTITPEQLAAAQAEAEARGEDMDAKAEGQSGGGIFRGLVLTLFTKNLIAAAADNQLLPLIVFSIVFAGILTTMGSAAATLTRFITELNDALMRFIMLVMRLAPIGIFCLVAGRFGRASLEGKFIEELQKLAWYSTTVTLGLLLHALVTLPLIYRLVLRRNPYRFLVNMGQALLTAFSTSSSSATLPVTIEVAEQKAGVSKKAAGFVLPLGSTINMDGTALYEATAALFLAQVSGMDLGLGDQLVVAVTATLAAIGAAGVPEAGLVTMLIVLKAVKLPAALVTLILPIDWLLDRVRTTVNVYGDSIGAAVLTPQLPDAADSGAALADDEQSRGNEPRTTAVVERPSLRGDNEPQTTTAVDRSGLDLNP